MKVVKCENGHLFDSDSIKACPRCGSEKYVPLGEAVESEMFKVNEKDLQITATNAEANKRPFLTSAHVMLHLLLPIFFLVVWCVLKFVPLGIERVEGIIMLVVIFGILLSINPIIMAVQSAKNLSYLKENGYYEAMCAETPAESNEYVVSASFVFCYKRRLCLPIRDIKNFKISGKKYINNSFKDSVSLHIWLNNEDSYCFMHYSGLKTEYGKKVIVECMNKVLRRNPRIVQVK